MNSSLSVTKDLLHETLRELIYEVKISFCIRASASNILVDGPHLTQRLMGEALGFREKD